MPMLGVQLVESEPVSDQVFSIPTRRLGLAELLLAQLQVDSGWECRS